MLSSLKWIVLDIGGMIFGLLAAAGVFTVIVAVGLVPRFAGKTHTGKHVIFYEEMVIAGTAVGGLLSLYESYFHGGEYLTAGGNLQWAVPVIGNVLLVIFGFFAGMFVGVLHWQLRKCLTVFPFFPEEYSLGMVWESLLLLRH